MPSLIGVLQAICGFGHRKVLIVDEAQNLSDEVLEEMQKSLF